MHGEALLVRLDPNLQWTPRTWPDSFEAIEALVAEATNQELSLSDWLKVVGWDAPSVPPSKKTRRHEGPHQYPKSPPPQRPTLVVFLHEGTLFGFQLFKPLLPGLTAPAVEPVRLTRVDSSWALARDQDQSVLRERRKRRVLLLGCGSLGSPLAKALSRSGIGVLDIVDAQLMETENTSRHELGLGEVGKTKARGLADRLRAEVPGFSVEGHCENVQTWCKSHCKPGDYDLVVECTAESSVRTYLAHERFRLFGAVPLVHAWVEPLCSAGHVVLSQPETPWPADDPADSHVNASNLSASDTLIHPPACAAGFHPYAAADVQQVAAFAAERILGVLDELSLPSTVWSWVRSSAFFDAVGASAELRSIVPRSSSKWDSVTLTRDLLSVLEGA